MDREDELQKAPATAAVRAGEPPVVARLVVEIRSDGSRTIARGAIEDATEGRRVAVEAEGGTPFQLALALARAIPSLPSLARSAARALLPSWRRDDRRDGGRDGGDGRDDNKRR